MSFKIYQQNSDVHCQLPLVQWCVRILATCKHLLSFLPMSGPAKPTNNFENVQETSLINFVSSISYLIVAHKLKTVLISSQKQVLFKIVCLIANSSLWYGYHHRSQTFTNLQHQCGHPKCTILQLWNCWRSLFWQLTILK